MSKCSVLENKFHQESEIRNYLMNLAYSMHSSCITPAHNVFVYLENCFCEHLLKKCYFEACIFFMFSFFNFNAGIGE